MARGLAATTGLGLMITMAAVPSYAQEPDSAPALEQRDVASALAAAKRAGKRVKVSGATTASSEMFATPDGKIAEVISAGTARFRRNGSWVPVDLTLQRQADGSVAPAAHPNGLRISGARAAASADLAAMGSGVKRVAMGWTGALPEPQLSGSKATYAEVRPGIDLVVQATATGFEQFTVVKSAAAAKHVKEISLPLAGAGAASISEDKRGRVRVRNADGRQQAEIPTPMMWDARATRRGVLPKRRQVTADVVGSTATAARNRTAAPADASATLLLKPDQKWLTSPDTVYPVTIDPYVDWSTTATSTTVVSGFPTGWPDADSLFVGSYDQNLTARSFVTWYANRLQGTRVNSATAYFANPFSTSCDPTPWELWTTDPITDDTSWDNQPTWRQKEATSSETTCVDGWVTADATNFFQRAATGNVATPTMGLRAADENDYTQYKQFWSHNYTDTSKLPYVEVTYDYPTPGDTSGSTCAADADITMLADCWTSTQTLTEDGAAPTDTAAESTSTVTFGQQDSQNAALSIPEAYEESEADPAAGEELREEFVEQAAETAGLYYDSASVDYLALERTDNAAFGTVEIVAPEDYEIQEVGLQEAVYDMPENEASADGDEEQTGLTAAVVGTVNMEASDVVLPDGPGFASFAPSGSGQYILKTAVGQMLATWAKAKVSGDGDSKKDYWEYLRKARVSTKDIRGIDYRIAGFGIKSYPKVYSMLRNWLEWQPSTGAHRGDCNNQPITVTAGFRGVGGLEYSFQDCDKYTAYMLDDRPGDFSVGWSQGKLPTSGPRETAFAWSAGGPQGKGVTIMDYQWVKFKEGFATDGSPYTIPCESTNANKTC